MSEITRLRLQAAEFNFLHRVAGLEQPQGGSGAQGEELGHLGEVWSRAASPPPQEEPAEEAQASFWFASLEKSSGQVRPGRDLEEDLGEAVGTMCPGERV